jgi:hypothetical protein
MNSISSALSPSVKAELELDAECDRLNWSTFTILGMPSCRLGLPIRDTGCLQAGLRSGAPPLTGEPRWAVTCRVGVLGVGKELEDEEDDGGRGMVERVGVLGFEARSDLIGGVGMFRVGDDREWGDGLVGEDGGRTL